MAGTWREPYADPAGKNFLPMLQKAIEADGYSKETAAEVVQKLSK